MADRDIQSSGESTTDLHLIDPSTGQSLGFAEVRIDGHERTRFDGLAISPSGVLFAFSGGPTSGLYTINRTNGIATLIGTHQGYVEGADFNGDRLIASTFAGFTHDQYPTLLEISTADGSSTDIVTSASPSAHVRALATLDATTMLLRSDDSAASPFVLPNLHSVDLLSGNNIDIGDLGTQGSNSLAGMDFASNGILYGLSYDGGEIYEIDPMDATTTLIADTPYHWLSATTAPLGAVAPSNGVPDLGTSFTLLALSLMGICVGRRLGTSGTHRPR